MKWICWMTVTLGCWGSMAVADTGWTNLINGKNLDNWVKHGGRATYALQDGCIIVGTAVLNSQNTFLCTKRNYANFILEYEFKCDPRLNSGVQVRSHCHPEPSEVLWEDQVIQVPAGRVHGYQLEIDPEPTRDRWWMAGVYDEACRGWLYPGICGGNGLAFRKQGKRLYKPLQWNKVRLELIGSSFKTWLNGEQRADFHDSRVQYGFIGLQVHSIKDHKADAGAKVYFRNIRIKDLGGMPNTLTSEEKAAGWKLLWDGKTTKGWHSARGGAFPKTGWSIDHDSLVIHKNSGAGDIITDGMYSDFELKLDFKLTPGANSGIKMFIDAKKGPGSSIGPEFQILDDKRHPDSNKGRNGDRKVGSLYDLVPAPKGKKTEPVGAWNHAHILSRGKHLTFWLNGEKTVDIIRGSEEWKQLVAESKFKRWPNFGMLEQGHILLQDHHNEVFFRNIKIRTTFK